MSETGDERKKRLARERMQRFRENHPNYDRDKSRVRRAEHPGYRWPRQLINLKKVNEIKSGPCTDCGNCFPTVCMDFDHLPGSAKTGNVGTMVSAGRSWESIKAEIDKCELVCSNCHRIRTHERSLQNAGFRSVAEDSPAVQGDDGN